MFGKLRSKGSHLAEVDLTGVTNGEIEDFAEYARQLAEAGEGGKTGIVFNGIFELGIGRLFEAYLEIGALAFAIDCFRSFEEAIDWLDFGGNHDYGDKY